MQIMYFLIFLDENLKVIMQLIFFPILLVQWKENCTVLQIKQKTKHTQKCLHDSFHRGKSPLEQKAAVETSVG